MSTQSSAPQPVVYLAALDGTPAATQVLDLACGLANALPGTGELHIVYVMGAIAPEAAAIAGAPIVPSQQVLDSARTVLDKACAQAREKFSGRIVGHVGAGDPWREIVNMGASLRADLIIVGTTGKKGLARLALGSVAEKVVRHAGCPVLVARPKDHHVAEVPEIEPPCPDCLEVQRATKRQQLWCARHSQHHTHGRTHYEVPQSFAMGSMLVRP